MQIIETIMTSIGVSALTAFALMVWLGRVWRKHIEQREESCPF
jgi:hypothetical protein